MAALFTGLVSVNSAAQTQWWDSTKSAEGVSLSAQVGLNLSRFTNVELWNSMRPGLNIGVIAEKPIFNSLAVKAGILYTMKGAKGINDAIFGGTLTTTFSPAYLEIPILASYRLQCSDDLRFAFDFGPYFAFGLHGKDKKKYTGSPVASDSDREIDLFTEQLKRFDFGFQLGPSVVYKDRFSAGMIFDCGVADISNMGDRIGNFTFMINLGYKFHTFK